MSFISVTQLSYPGMDIVIKCSGFIIQNGVKKIEEAQPNQYKLASFMTTDLVKETKNRFFIHCE